MAEMKFNWVDNPTASGIAECNTDVLNDCLMHLKYDNGGGTGLQMFDTILKDYILTYEESKGLELQGTYVYKEALAGSRYGYPDFYNKCLEEKNTATATQVTLSGSTITMYIASNGHQYYDIANKDVIDTFFGTMGSAWFYGVDTANERIFLPRNNYFDQATGDVSEVGQSVEAGLPNITGKVGTDNESAYDGDPTGAFYASGNAHRQGHEYTVRGVSFDASRSNPIYGNSNTVQPNAVKKLLYICVGNTTNYEGVTDVVNQGMNILEQVNQGIETRVAKESMSEVPCITETYVNGTSGYRIWSDNFKEQWGQSSSINAQTSTTVNLLKSFSNTNYYLNANQPLREGTALPTMGVTQINTSSFVIHQSSTNNQAGSWAVKWYACGY